MARSLDNPAPDGAAVSSPATPPFSKPYRVYILGMLFATYLCNYMDRSIIGILMPQIKGELHLRDWQIGILAGAAFSFFYGAAAIPISYIVDRSRRVTLLSASIAFWSIMTAACGYAGNFGQLLLARAGVGLGEAGSSPCAPTLISDLFGARSRATAFGIYNAGISFGSAIGLLVGANIAQTYGWRVAFIWIGLPGLLLALMMKLTVREPARGMSESVEAAAEPASVLEVARILFSTKLYRHYVVGASLSALVSLGSLVWAPSFLSRSYHLDLKFIGFWLAVTSFISGVIGNAAGGFVSDRLETRSLRGRFLFPAIAMALSIPFTIVGYWGGGIVLTLIFWSISKVAPHTITGPGQSTVQELVGVRMRGTAHAINFFTIAIVSGVLGPLLVGAASDLLASRYAEQSLRITLMGTVLFSAWSAVHFYLASRYAVVDLVSARAANIARLPRGRQV